MDVSAFEILVGDDGRWPAKSFGDVRTTSRQERHAIQVQKVLRCCWGVWAECARNSFLKMCPGWADDRIFQPVTNGGFQLSDIRKLLGRFQQVGRREKNCQYLSPGYAGDW